MTTGAGRDTASEDPDSAPTETPTADSDRIDLERLVWDPEYRRQISDLIKRGEPQD